MKKLRITPSKLGALAVANACPRCYWTLLQMNFKRPFNFPLPAVMQHLDLHEKQLARVALEKTGKLPSFFDGFEDAKRVLDIESFQCDHAKTGLTLFGKPDLVFGNRDGSISIVDNKTAAVKPDDHPLAASYKLQLNMYAYMAERQQPRYKISKLGILYFTSGPFSDDEILKHVGDTAVLARFEPVMVDVAYDPKKIVEPLLMRVNELLEEDKAPEGNKFCRDCALLEAYLQLASGQPLSDSLPHSLTRQEADRYRVKLRMQMIDGTTKPSREELLPALQSVATPNSVLSVWDFNESE